MSLILTRFRVIGQNAQLIVTRFRVFVPDERALILTRFRVFSDSPTALTAGDEQLVDPGELVEIVINRVSLSMPAPASWARQQIEGPVVATVGADNTIRFVAPGSDDGVIIRFRFIGTMPDGTTAEAIAKVTVRGNPGPKRQVGGNWFDGVISGEVLA